MGMKSTLLVIPTPFSPIQISGRKETNTSNQYHPRDSTDLNDTLHPERKSSITKLDKKY
jgi:hypothetical protein